MRAALFTICLIAVLTFAGFLIHGCAVEIDADDVRRDRKEQDWLTFSVQHRCRMSKPSSFPDPNETWQCDGFEVRR